MHAIDRFELRISPADRLRLRALALETQESEAEVVRQLIRRGPVVLASGERKSLSLYEDLGAVDPPLDAA